MPNPYLGQTVSGTIIDPRTGAVVPAFASNQNNGLPTGYLPNSQEWISPGSVQKIQTGGGGTPTATQIPSPLGLGSPAPQPQYKAQSSDLTTNAQQLPP